MKCASRRHQTLSERRLISRQSKISCKQRDPASDLRRQSRHHTEHFGIIRASFQQHLDLSNRDPRCNGDEQRLVNARPIKFGQDRPEHLRLDAENAKVIAAIFRRVEGEASLRTHRLQLWRWTRVNDGGAAKI